MALTKKQLLYPPEGFEKTLAPSCIVQVEASQFCLAVDFTLRDHRVQGFPYAHLLGYLYEKNPNASLPPNAPDQFTFSFSTHDVVLVGWRLAGLAPLVRQGKLVSVLAQPEQYQGLAESQIYAYEIRVNLPKKE